MLSNILMNVKNVCGAQGKLEHGFYHKYLCKISILSIVHHQEVLYLFHKSRTMSGKNVMKYGTYLGLCPRQLCSFLVKNQYSSIMNIDCSIMTSSNHLFRCYIIFMISETGLSKVNLIH